MKRLVILGAGTAGTMAANKLRRHLAMDEWQITIVDRDVETHLFFTFWGFDMITKSRMHELKFTMLGNTATHMPQGLGGLPGMTALATYQR